MDRVTTLTFVVFWTLAIPLTLWFGRWQDQSRRRAAQRDAQIRDLDETRRLLYMILAVPSTPTHSEAVATAANALAHHSKAVSVEESLTRLAAAASGEDDTQWVRDRIAEITDKLGDHPSATG